MGLFNLFTDFCVCIGNLLTSKIELLIQQINNLNKGGYN